MGAGTGARRPPSMSGLSPEIFDLRLRCGALCRILDPGSCQTVRRVK